MLTNVITIDPVASGGYKEWVSTLLWKIIHNICESLDRKVRAGKRPRAGLVQVCK